MQFLSIMDYVQALFSFFIAPLFGTVILGNALETCDEGRVDFGDCGRVTGVVNRHVAWVKIDPSAFEVWLRFQRMPETWRRICIARCGRLICAWRQMWWLDDKPQTDAD